MLAPETLAAFVSAALLVIVVPGPTMLMVLGQLRHSRLRAAAAVAGVVLGDLLLIAAAGLGLSALLQQWPLLLSLLRWGGAAYVAWMGVSMLRAEPGPARAAPAAGGFRAALLLTLVNPKPVLFFAAFFPLFLGAASAPGGAWLSGFLLLGLLFELLNVGCYALLIGAAGALGRRLRWRAIWVQRASGAALLLCALLVLLA
ncbi:LysE family transporter [Roseateles sp. DAIF2]|uniref:LysE family translocator n=1 Tax=Roseateles sp. DAIF2 TaxID=2714952 RepID=UPI0018A2C53B|nr:LysE family transporter [Roseateles sp. DAIF2]QPF72586.1 LysE family transporter [Roseateles sp. DAIF2]